MARNGSGVQSSPGASYPAVASTLIESAKFNAVIDDINSVLTLSWAADGQTTVTANIPMNSKKFTGILDGSARTDSNSLGQVQDGKLNWVAGGGTSAAITATYSPAITALVDGQVCFVRATAANGTSALTTVSITGTAGEFLCDAASLMVGQRLVISGTLGGTGTITGYVNPTTYKISATNGTTTLTLTTTNGTAIVTTAGTPTGLTYTIDTVTTFAPNGLTARTIVKKGAVPLVAGDIEAVGHELILRYLLASTRWELMNPASGSFTAGVSGTQLTSTIATGTAPFVVSSTTEVANLKAATATSLANTASQKLPDIDVTQAAGALTVAVNAAIYQDFRSTTLTDGTPTTVLADPADLVVPSGATLGAISTVAANIAVLMLNNAGTAELAVVNLSGGVNLDESGVISTTLIDTGSDSAGVVYSTAARTNVAYKVVKRFTAVNTAGAWASPSAVADVIGGVSRKMAQMVTFETGAVATGTTTIPFDDTIPQITEGDQYMSLAITPTNVNSKLEIEVLACTASGVGGRAACCLFQDATANALTVVMNEDGASAGVTSYLKHIMTAGTVSATTFRVRIGYHNAGTTTFNGETSARLYGGVMASRITIKEYLP